MKKEMQRNQEIFAANLNLQPVDTALFVNGLFYDIDLIDVYGILDILRQELRTMEGLHKFGISNERLTTLLALDFSDSGSSSQEFAMDLRDSAINWVNDIENDSKYSRWSPNLMDLLRPTFPGMVRQIRRNLFNLVRINNRPQNLAYCFFLWAGFRGESDRNGIQRHTEIAGIVCGSYGSNQGGASFCC